VLLPGDCDRRRISWTLEDRDIVSDVWRDHAILLVAEKRSVSRPGKLQRIALQPGVIRRRYAAVVGIWKKQFVVISRVKDRRLDHLLTVVHAKNALRLCFRFRKRRQQHSGENRDDRDHHEQLDQSEPAGARSGGVWFG
jgi:hypothetical protein